MKPKTIFLDLDGVLVDFESGVYEIVKRYSDSPDLMNTLTQEKREAVKMMLRKMDGEGVSKTTVAELLRDKLDKETLRDLVSMDKNWWANLGWMSDGKELWNFMRKYDPIILSSDFDRTNSTQGKTKWVKKNLGPDVRVIIVDNKGDYATPDSLLIDDRQFVLDGFMDAGGQGLLHISTENTIEEITSRYALNESNNHFRYIKSFKDWNK